MLPRVTERHEADNLTNPAQNDEQPAEHCPVTIDVIEYVLMHALRDASVFEVCREHLTPDLINLPHEISQAAIWQAALDHYEAYGNLPTYQALSTTVVSQLSANPAIVAGTPEKADNLLRWMYDSDTNPDRDLEPQAAIGWLKTILHDRKIGQRMKPAVQEAPGGSVSDIPELIEEWSQEATSIASVGMEQRVPTFGDELEGFFRRIETSCGRQLLGLRTGMNILDERLSGVRGLILFGAAPGVGKSVFCSQIGVGICRHSVEGDNHACVLYLSLDMSADDCKTRLLCFLSGMDWKTLKLGSPGLRGNADGPYHTPGHQSQLEQAKQKVRDWQIDRRLSILGRDEVGALDAARIAMMATALKTQTGARNCLVVVDYLQLLDVPEKVAKQGDLEADKHRVRMPQQVLDSSKDEDGEIVDSVIAISEARKPSTSTARHRWGHKVEDLMGSARLGYAADAVLLMRPMNPEEMNERFRSVATGEGLARDLDQDGISPLMFELAKGRDGMTRGQWPAEFHFRRGTISEGAV